MLPSLIIKYFRVTFCFIFTADAFVDRMSVDSSTVLIVEFISEDITKVFEQASDCGGTYSFWGMTVVELNGGILVVMLRFVDY